MNDVKTRELFLKAAEGIPVQSPPDIARLARAQRRRSGWVWLAPAAATAIVVIGVVGGSSLTGPPDNGSSPAPSEQRTSASSQPSTPGVASLSCPNNLREELTWEATGPVRETPQQLSDMFADPTANERAVVGVVKDNSATAYILRPDGSARAALSLRHDTQGWELSGWKACPGSWVRLHQSMGK